MHSRECLISRCENLSDIREKMAAIFPTIFSNAFVLNKNVWILNVPKGEINNIPQI